MIKKLLFFLLLLSSLSCSRTNEEEDEEPINKPTTTLAYSFMGSRFTYIGSLPDSPDSLLQGSVIRKGNYEDDSSVGYALFSHNKGRRNYLHLILHDINSLEVKTYNITYPPYNKLGRLNANNQNIGFSIYNFRPGDFVEFTITKIENGYASGKFKAKMNTYDIIDGEFENVLIEE